jgi:hypothetical protein
VPPGFLPGTSSEPLSDASRIPLFDAVLQGHCDASPQSVPDAPYAAGPAGNPPADLIPFGATFPEVLSEQAPGASFGLRVAQSDATLGALGAEFAVLVGPLHEGRPALDLEELVVGSREA